MHEVEKFFCQFPNPWTLRVSGMGGYTSKCEKKSKSLHPSGQANFCKKFDKSHIRKFWGTLRYRKSANLLGVPVRKLRIRKFL